MDSTPTPEPRRLAVVSSSRADMSHLIWPLRAFATEPALQLTVLACGAALSGEYGRSADRMRAEGFSVIEVGDPLGIDTAAEFAVAIGGLTTAFSGALQALGPDLLMVVADRAEMLAPATAALTMRIPLIHVEGGERSEGAIDDATRNALTKLSHVHFVTSEQAARRVAALGEEPWRIHQVGAASLDHIRHSALPDARGSLKGRGFDVTAPLIVVSIHPATLESASLAEGHAVLEALRSMTPRECPQVLFCFPNADHGGRLLRDACTSTAQTLNARGIRSQVVVQFEPEAWFSVLLHPFTRAIVGNSSSVVMEAPALGLPAVLVGNRQAGRELAASTRMAAPDCPAILAAIRRAVGTPRVAPWSIAQPYGDGNASARMAAAIRTLPARERLLHKLAAPLR